jgi:hypothetical protein
LIERNQLEKPIYRQAIKDLMSIAIIVYNKHSDKQITAVYDNMVVDIAEIRTEIDPVEKQKQRAMAKVNGTESRIDWIIEDNPDLSREDAVEEAKRIDSENNLYPTSGLGESMGIGE